ncbi:hypothetical protein GGI26_000634 [Coemansia sp. RSA 1358]|uniref:Glutathione S-transferase n=1 Tax=Coemansia umbellata TaxID=1424467 RepID=A0ABQ8PUW4_9FUNG|nr:hypothetical protein EDC05_000421 [Coemansia umbellata]KAJ2625494.1 hypothetical protein GGI26_000634 [Coemansia sp. RSA 1358]
MRPTQPFGCLPVLVEKGINGSPDFILSESGTIERCIARKHGLLPRNPKEASRQEQLRDQVIDIINACYGAYLGFGEFKKFDELSAKLKDILTKALKGDVSNSHFAGDKLTYIDLYIYAFFKSFITNMQKYASQYTALALDMATPGVAKLIATVIAKPCLQSRAKGDIEPFPFLI